MDVVDKGSYSGLEVVGMKHILIVDDDRFNLIIAYDTLKKHYMVSVANSGQEALDILKEKEVDLILLDIEMPEMNGIETLEKIKENNKTAKIPVIFLTAINDNKVEAKCIELGAQDYIVKPFYEPAMLVRIRRTLELEDLRKHLESLVSEKTKEIECLTVQTITSFANSIDAKDSYTKYHSQHVAKYAEKMAKKLGWDKSEILHDIGKIGIPDYILNKPGKLSAEEYEIIKKHPVVGGDILSEVTVVPYLSVGARNHHERYDGRGYPSGKKGEETPLVGRIVSIADAVDAMISTRAYREGGSIERAIEELKRCSGTQFDPELVPIMIEILEEGIEFLDKENSLEKEHALDDDSSLISIVLSEYSKATQIDSMTGLWNKSYVQTKINELLYLFGRECAFLLIDIDSSRRIANFSGHEKVDEVTVALAQCIVSEVDENDLVGRYDNDKFIVYLTDINSIEQAEFKMIQILKAMNKKLEDMELPIKVYVSIGAAIPTEMENDFTTLYHNADKALYYAKRAGDKDYYIYAEETDKDYEAQMANTTVDLWKLKIMLAERAVAEGIYRVEMHEFEKIFKLLQRKGKRSAEPMSMLLFTIVTSNGNKPEQALLNEAGKNLIVAMNDTLRAGDIVTKYGSNHYIVLLTGVKLIDTDWISRRVKESFEEANVTEGLNLLCEAEQII
jgi:putative two-component system response regulator